MIIHLVNSPNSWTGKESLLIISTVAATTPPIKSTVESINTG